jgi:hypothetical protein
MWAVPLALLLTQPHAVASGPRVFSDQELTAAAADVGRMEAKELEDFIRLLSSCDMFSSITQAQLPCVEASKTYWIKYRRQREIDRVIGSIGASNALISLGSSSATMAMAETRERLTRHNYAHAILAAAATKRFQELHGIR